MNQFGLKDFHTLLCYTYQIQEAYISVLHLFWKQRPLGVVQSSLSHRTTEVSRSLTSLCKNRIKENWIVAIMHFCYISFQIYWIEQKFYKDINFLFLSDVCCKTLFLFGRILPFLGWKIRAPVQCGNDMGLFQEENSLGRLSGSLCSTDLFLRMMHWTHIHKEAYQQHNGCKGPNTSSMYPIIQEYFSFTNKSSSCACLHSVPIPENQSEQCEKWILFTLSVDLVFTRNELNKKERIGVCIKYMHVYTYMHTQHPLEEVSFKTLFRCQQCMLLQAHMLFRI